MPNIQGSQRPLPSGFSANTAYGMFTQTTSDKRWLIFCPIGVNQVMGTDGAGNPVAISISTLQGQVGATGAKGDTGSQGLAGAQGIKGDTGNIGLTGPQGSTGTTGPQGIQGLTGLQGATGPAGTNAAQPTIQNVSISGSYTVVPQTGATPTRTFLYLTSSIANPAVTLGETGIAQGSELKIINVGSTNSFIVSDTASVSESSGNFTVGPTDVIEYIYGLDRWYEAGRSNN